MVNGQPKHVVGYMKDFLFGQEHMRTPLEVLAGGGDWVTARADGTLELDLRVTLETEDGALIYMTFTGVRDDPNHYFRTLPRFETAADKYGFLNRVLAIGIGVVFYVPIIIETTAKAIAKALGVDIT